MNLDDYFGTKSRKATTTNRTIMDAAGGYSQPKQASSNPLEAIFNALVVSPGKAVVDFFGSNTARVANLFDPKKANEEAEKFSNWVYGSNNAKETAARRLGSALDLAAAGTNVFAPGVAGALAGGALRGAGSEFTQEGANADIGRALGRAGVGAIAEGVSAGALKGAGKLAQGTGLLGRGTARLTNPQTILGNVGRGAISGMTEGAIQGAGNTLVSGGSLSDALNAGVGGFGSGALMGGIGGGVMGTAAKGIRSVGNRFSNRSVAPGQTVPSGRTTMEADTDTATQLEGSRAGSTSSRQLLEGDSIKPIKTGDQIRNERAATNEVVQQFGRVSAPVQRMTQPAETFSAIPKQMGLTAGDDIRGAAAALTGRDGVVSEVIRDAAGDAGLIDVTDVLDIVKKLPKAQQNKIRPVLTYIMDSTPSSVSGGKMGIDALNLQRQIQQIAADAEGMGGQYKIGNHSVDDIMAKNMTEAANLIGDRIDEAGDIRGSVGVGLDAHAAEIDQLLNMFPGNKQWTKYINDEILGAKTISGLRNSIKNITRAGIYIENADNQAFTFGAGMSGNVNVPLSAKTATGMLLDATANKARQSSAGRGIANRYYQNRAEGGGVLGSAVKAVTNRPNTGAAPTTTPKVRTSAEIPTGIANAARNAIGTNEGVRAMGTQTERNNQAVDQNIAQILQDYLLSGGNMQNIQAPQQMSNQSAQNILQQLQTAPAMQQPVSTPTTLQGALNGPTIGGLSQQQIQENMLIALQYGDSTMFNNLSKLNDMFNTASKPAQTKLSATQQRANAAATSLQQLSGMTPDMGYNLSGIPLLGDIATLGGNQYESTAKSLATQIGYMLSGANISEREAENIGKAYVPQPWDSEETRRYKLQQAQRIVAQYQQAYVEDTPTLETVLY